MKNFDEWNVRKKLIDSLKEEKIFHEREIWRCFVGINIGVENDGRGNEFIRPVLILKKFNKEMFVGIPISHSVKGIPYFHSITINGSPSSLLLSQIRVFDAKRLHSYISRISRNEQKTIQYKLCSVVLNLKIDNEIRESII